jgi:hypothetical protein
MGRARRRARGKTHYYRVMTNALVRELGLHPPTGRNESMLAFTQRDPRCADRLTWCVVQAPQNRPTDAGERDAKKHATCREDISMSRITWVAMCLMLLGVGVAAGQDYPNRPILMLSGAIGSSADLVARMIAQGLTESLGKQVIVDNRFSGALLGHIVAKAAPDGYTLLATSSSLWLVPFLQDSAPFDPLKDFAPITQTVSAQCNVGWRYRGEISRLQRDARAGPDRCRARYVVEVGRGAGDQSGARFVPSGVIGAHTATVAFEKKHQHVDHGFGTQEPV